MPAFRGVRECDLIDFVLTTFHLPTTESFLTTQVSKISAPRLHSADFHHIPRRVDKIKCSDRNRSPGSIISSVHRHYLSVLILLAESIYDNSVLLVTEQMPDYVWTIINS